MTLDDHLKAVLTGSREVAERYWQLAKDRRRAEVEAARSTIYPARPLSRILAEIVDDVGAGRNPATATEAPPPPPQGDAA